MSSLRKVNRELPEEFVDAEAPTDGGAARETANDIAAISTSDSFSAPSGSGHNPVFLAKAIFGKVAGLLVSPDDEDATLVGRTIAFLRDLVVGVILGVAFVSVLVFLDHRDIIHFQSAHYFRNAAFQLLNDPETIANIEEASKIKLLTIDEYESRRKEIDSFAEKLVEGEANLEKRTKEAVDKKAELAAVKAEHESLMNNPLLELNKYCGGCPWAGKTTCDARVQFLQQKYSSKPIAAKMSVMEVPSCKKQ
eukprot:CAMPEP_0172576314 /NCGR_PEP_ID=MMETSP1067-20121228/137658_1 /TAXON_ID=265564 ORGANISM="Thalassiosira punctigera, Strain Tpunct2005C2" /NCGR_SAMPLE_ID=MMETSP1067 /ASSEMBLY_ACC=CAM_ASM_000444 /LENGTH=250 /DNA_ID=CAMNT_0013368979 /DNA_START=65 /DNA_END=817 /DNA_ORIENTATION=-